MMKVSFINFILNCKCLCREVETKKKCTFIRIQRILIFLKLNNKTVLSPIENERKFQFKVNSSRVLLLSPMNHKSSADGSCNGYEWP